MLSKNDLKNITKPFLLVLVSKALLFIAILIFLSVTNNTGLNSQNLVVSACQNYLNFKYTNYYNAIKAVEFVFTILGTLVSCLQMSMLLFFVVLNKMKKQGNINQQQKYTENRLKLQLVFNFLQLLFISNVFARSIETAVESQSCTSVPNNKNAVLLTLSTITFFFSMMNCAILLKVLKFIRDKMKDQNYMNECLQYAQSSSIRANLLYNKQGYMKDLLNLENYNSKTNELKYETVKHFPKGINKDTIIPTKQIVFRLRGGNKKSNLEPQKLNESKNKAIPEQQQEFSFELSKEGTNNAELQTVFNMWPKIEKTYKKEGNFSDKDNLFDMNDNMYLKVNPPKYQMNPNSDDREAVETTLNVLSFTIGNIQTKKKKKKKDDEKEDDDNDSTTKRKASEDKLELSKQKPKTDKKILSNQKIRERSQSQFNQQILKANYNLAPETQNRRKMAMRRNVQNIDENGKYYFVDLQTIQKKDKTFKKAVADEFSGVKSQQDPNVSYSIKQWNPKSKRRQKQHNRKLEKRIQERQKILKQEIQFYNENSSYVSDSSYESSDESEQQNQKAPEEQLLKENGQKYTPQELQELKKKQTEKLYLHMKKKKITGIQNKLKLFEEEEGFYDDNQEQDSQIKNLDPLDPRRIQFEKNKENAQKGKYDYNKAELTNKELQTQEYNMLQFIRSKYVDPQMEWEESYTYTLHEEDEEQQEYTQNEEGQYEQYQEEVEQEQTPRIGQK